MMESPDKLAADLNEAAAALSALPDGHRLAMAVIQARDLNRHLSLALEATCAMAGKAALSIPELMQELHAKERGKGTS